VEVSQQLVLLCKTVFGSLATKSRRELLCHGIKDSLHWHRELVWIVRSLFEVDDVNLVNACLA
jgi:hypothetical protein